jgi:nickel-dependent lactate racemase
MKVDLAYGRGMLGIEVPKTAVVIEPAHQSGLADERAALRQRLDQPTGAPPLREAIRAESRICIVFTDITRATPNERLIPWLLEYLEENGARRENITLLNSLGTHRPNTYEELCKLLTRDVVDHYRVLNHEPENPAAHVQFGVTRSGTPALINRHLIDADLRIITGFIEPHFFAGFSGGPKGIMPGVAALETVMSNHGRVNLSDPNSTFGITEGNPVWEEMRDIALRIGPSFLINVTLNSERAITGVFAGDLIESHREGWQFVKKSAMQPVDQLFDIVVSTNSGYPLDLNLYQAVKGMSAAARIVKPGGTIILAAECSTGIPSGSAFDSLLRKAQSSEDILRLIAEETYPEQWQAQIQALIQRTARVYLYSSLSEDHVRTAHLLHCADISDTIAALLRNHPDASIAVLPHGPLTIPYQRTEK